MLTYHSYHPSEIKFQPEVEDECSNLFKPPVKDFAVAQITVPADMTYSLTPRSSASIILVISGKSVAKSSLGVTNMKKGVVLFLPAQEKLTLAAENEQILYQAFCNL